MLELHTVTVTVSLALSPFPLYKKNKVHNYKVIYVTKTVRHVFVNMTCVSCVLLQIMPDYYHFQHRKVSKRSLGSSSHVHRLLVEEPEVSTLI